MDAACKVCDRVCWGNWVPLGHNHWRHEECYPGSETWLEAYRNYSPTMKTTESELIYKRHIRDSMALGPVMDHNLEEEA